MKQIILSMIFGTVLWSTLVEARTCRDEPERCPVIRWSCSQPVPENAVSYTYFSAVITSSMFSGDFVVVKENQCVQSRHLNCQERNSQEWTLYPQIPQGQLVNQMSGQRIIVDCHKYNNWL